MVTVVLCEGFSTSMTFSATATPAHSRLSDSNRLKSFFMGYHPFFIYSTTNTVSMSALLVGVLSLIR